MSHIFISYSRHDSEYAHSLARELTQRGLNVWIDVEHLEVGSNWRTEVFEAIGECAAFVVIMSPTSRESKWVQRELAFADDKDKPIYPLLLDGDHWDILILEQYEDVRNGELPRSRFFDRLAKKAPIQEHGINVRTKETAEQSLHTKINQSKVLDSQNPILNLTGQEVLIRPTDNGFAKGTYTGQNEFQSFQGKEGWTAFYKPTVPQRSTVWVQWSPMLPVSGVYEVAAYVPRRHATTHHARYKIHGVLGLKTEVVVAIDQSRHCNEWVSLGIFGFDKAAVNAGAVFINDLTYETGREIAFDAMRWRQVDAKG